MKKLMAAMIDSKMKKLFRSVINICIIVTLCMMSVFPVTVNAEGSITVSTDLIKLYKGDEKYFTIRANNAVGSIDIYSTDENIARVDHDSAWLDNDSLVVTVTAHKIGNCSIIVDVVDGATYDEEVIVTSFTIDIIVEDEFGPQEVMVPYASLDSGQVTVNSKLKLSCETPDAVIHYSINGGSFETYHDEIILSEGLLNDADSIEFELYADKSGNYLESEHNYYHYTLKSVEEDYGDLTEEDIAIYDDVSSIPDGYWISGIKDFVYDGKSHQQDDYRVYYHTTLLKKQQDYTVSYSNNINASNKGAQIIIRGKGNYSGIFTEYFSISALNLANASVDDILFQFNNRSHPINPRVTLNGKVLKKNTDYTFEQGQYVDVGEYTVTLTGKGNYTGTKTFKVAVTDKKPISTVSTAAIPGIQYNGEQYKPEVVFNVYTSGRNKIQLQKGIDYTLEYEDDCSSAGTHKVIIRAMDSSQYVAGTKTVTYSIKGTNLSIYKYADLVDLTYTGSEITPADPRLYRIVKQNGSNVREYLNSDGNYTISYAKNIETGTATVKYTGINGYVGTVTKTFRIRQADLSGPVSATVAMDSNYEYLKGGVFPEPVVKYKGITLVKDVDYKITYRNNTKVNDNTNSKYITSLTISGKGRYSGKIVREFTIYHKDINDLQFIAGDSPAGVYKSNVKLIDSNNRNLGSSDYTITSVTYNQNVLLKNNVTKYKGETVGKNDRIPANTVLRITVKGKGNYNGSRTALIKTYEKNIASVSASAVSKEYTGKEITLTKNDITLKSGKTYLTNDDFEILSYRNNIQKGTAVVVIKGRGVYGGTKEVKFKITDKSMYLKIRFDGNGATSGSMNDLNVYNPVNLPANKFRKNGQRFAGWSITRNGSKAYDDRDLYRYKSSDAGNEITLYAIWE